MCHRSPKPRQDRSRRSGRGTLAAKSDHVIRIAAVGMQATTVASTALSSRAAEWRPVSLFGTLPYPDPRRPSAGIHRPLLGSLPPPAKQRAQRHRSRHQRHGPTVRAQPAIEVHDLDSARDATALSTALARGRRAPLRVGYAVVTGVAWLSAARPVLGPAVARAAGRGSRVIARCRSQSPHPTAWRLFFSRVGGRTGGCSPSRRRPKLRSWIEDVTRLRGRMGRGTRGSPCSSSEG